LQVEREAARHPHKPQLSAHSAAYVHPLPAAERLFQHAQLQQQERERVRVLKEAVESKFDLRTGRELFKPMLGASRRGPGTSSSPRPTVESSTDVRFALLRAPRLLLLCSLVSVMVAWGPR
jgi:hypothetical protein